MHEGEAGRLHEFARTSGIDRDGTDPHTTHDHDDMTDEPWR